MNLPPLILASASPRRSQLLESLGLKFRVLPAQIAEVQPEHLSPAETCQINAYRKARFVAKLCPDSLVLGADTIVCLGHAIYGKPADHADALRMLLELQGREHLVMTGVCLLHLRSHHQRIFAEISRVHFRPLDVRAARAYLERIHPLDKAGAYAIQEHGDMIIHSIEGSRSNVIGLPVERLGEVLANWPASPS